MSQIGLDRLQGALLEVAPFPLNPDEVVTWPIVVDAARAYLAMMEEAREVWWCVVHDCPGNGPITTDGPLPQSRWPSCYYREWMVMADFGDETDECEMVVRMRLLVKERR